MLVHDNNNMIMFFFRSQYVTRVRGWCGEMTVNVNLEYVSIYVSCMNSAIITKRLLYKNIESGKTYFTRKIQRRTSQTIIVLNLKRTAYAHLFVKNIYIIKYLSPKSYELKVVSDSDGFLDKKLQSKSRSRGLVTPLASSDGVNTRPLR